jgi:methionyl-tRNA synthetase
VPANEFLNLEGQKISTSRNWAIWLNEYLEDFPNRTDELRYVLTSIAPETKDSDFTWRDYQLKVNSELVAILGNFVNRALVLTHKFYNGIVPSGDLPISEHPLEDPLVQKSIALHHIVKIDFDSFEDNIQNFKFREAQTRLMDIAREGNRYLAETEPWKLIKQNPEQAAYVIKNCLDLCLQIACIAAPLLPETARRMKQQLNVENELYTYDVEATLRTGHMLNAAEHLYKNIEDAEIQAQLDKLEANKAAATVVETTPTVKPAKPEIVYDDFAKMDIRVGTVLEAERVPKTDKLMKLKIDTGLDVRTVVSGIAHHFEPEDVVGRQVSILVNLAPRKLKGIDSQGMILMAEDADGKLKFVTPTEAVANGSGVS